MRVLVGYVERGCPFFHSLLPLFFVCLKLAGMKSVGSLYSNCGLHEAFLRQMMFNEHIARPNS